MQFILRNNTKLFVFSYNSKTENVEYTLKRTKKEKKKKEEVKYTLKKKNCYAVSTVTEKDFKSLLILHETTFGTDNIDNK